MSFRHSYYLLCDHNGGDCDAHLVLHYETKGTKKLQDMASEAGWHKYSRHLHFCAKHWPEIKKILKLEAIDEQD